MRSNADYLGALRENEQNLVVIKFFAPWCRSCKAMDVKYRKLAAQNKNVKFFEVGFCLDAPRQLPRYKVP